MKSLEAMVEAYLSERSEKAERYLRFYRIQRSLKDAVTKAAMAELPGGKRSSHQRRIPRRVLEQATEALLNVDLQAAKSFDELYGLVYKTISVIPGIGRLTIYDTAQRISAYLNLRPEAVYLHAGTRKGARAMKLDHRAEKLALAVFPPELQKLRADQMEDFLCIYKDELKHIFSARCD